MLLLYHSEGCKTSETVFHWCYVSDLCTTPCNVMSGHHIVVIQFYLVRASTSSMSVAIYPCYLWNARNITIWCYLCGGKPYPIDAPSSIGVRDKKIFGRFFGRKCYPWHGEYKYSAPFSGKYYPHWSTGKDWNNEKHMHFQRQQAESKQSDITLFHNVNHFAKTGLQKRLTLWNRRNSKVVLDIGHLEDIV
jgi:hypothetical protein